MSDVARTQHVREFFDEDSTQYVGARYPDEARTCDQLSYLTRRRHVLEMLDRIGARGRVLDIGCGPGVLTEDLLQRGWQVSGIDLSMGMLAVARQTAAKHSGWSVGLAAAQATRLPFRVGSFDAVLCIGVVSYVDDLVALLKEIRNVLRPGGQAIFQISNAWSVSELDARLRGWLRRMVPHGGPRDATDRFNAVVRLQPYRPGDFEAQCALAGLEKREFRFYNFRPPLAVDRLAPALSLRAGRRLEALGLSRLATALAAGYLVRVARKPTCEL